MNDVSSMEYNVSYFLTTLSLNVFEFNRYFLYAIESLFSLMYFPANQKCQPHRYPKQLIIEKSITHLSALISSKPNQIYYATIVKFELILY